MNNLVPAITRKLEVELEFQKRVYDDEMFWYTGYQYCHGTEINLADNVFQFAYLDEDDKVTGYFAYRIMPETDTVCNFGLYSFEKNNVPFIKQVYKHLEMLVQDHRRLEFRAIGGNPVIRNYISFVERHKGNYVVLHDVTKDNKGHFHDEYIFEIVKGN